MFEKISSFIVKYQLKYPKKFILVFILLNLLFIHGIFNLIGNVEPSLEKVLPQDVQEIKTMNAMRSEFGADMIYLVVYTKNELVDVRDPAYLRYIDLLSQKIQTRDHVLEINSISSVYKYLNAGNLPSSINDARELGKLTPEFMSYVDSDYSFSVIKIRTNTGASSKVINELITQIKEDINSVKEFGVDVDTKITGFSAIDRATFKVIMSDFAIITLVSMIGISIIVFITFKSLIKGMLPMIIVINSLIWTMGIVGYFNLTITVVSMVSAAMIMGLGIDFGIHQVHSYYEERKQHNPKKSLEITMSELLRAMIGASLTTMAGFLALLFGVLPAMKVLGIILSIGIFTTLIGAIFLLPPLIYLYDRNKVERKTIA